MMSAISLDQSAPTDPISVCSRLGLRGQGVIEETKGEEAGSERIGKFRALTCNLKSGLNQLSL